jgi:hypothetical protein
LTDDKFTLRATRFQQHDVMDCDSGIEILFFDRWGSFLLQHGNSRGMTQCAKGYRPYAVGMYEGIGMHGLESAVHDPSGQRGLTSRRCHAECAARRFKVVIATFSAVLEFQGPVCSTAGATSAVSLWPKWTFCLVVAVGK